MHRVVTYIHIGYISKRFSVFVLHWNGISLFTVLMHLYLLYAFQDRRLALCAFLLFTYDRHSGLFVSGFFRLFGLFVLLRLLLSLAVSVDIQQNIKFRKAFELRL